MNMTQRYRGCLIGLATGDALGATLEFRTPGAFEPITDMIGGGPFMLKPGEWTDDTSMALCLAASLLERNGFDPRDQMEKYLLWFKEGYMSSNGRCFDIGATVRRALLRYVERSDPLSGSQHPRSAGNGPIMRLAPVPLFYSASPCKAIELSGESSKTTHRARTCVDACRYFGGLLLGAIMGVHKDLLLSGMYSPIAGLWEKEPLCEEIESIAMGSFKQKEPPAIKGSGYVVQSLEAALWAFYRSDSFKEGCLMAANLGDDSDTTAAVFGQIAGAYYGLGGIPENWRNRLAKLGLIMEIADSLHDTAGQRSS
jgi:ADP-ribosylglycohydrolase